MSKNKISVTSLKDRALLVRVTTSKLNGTRKDAEATTGLADLYHTSEDHVTATKRTLPANILSPCRKITSQAGNYLKGKTAGPVSGKRIVGGLAPWSISGSGSASQGTFYICPNALNEQVTRDLGAFDSQLVEAKEKLAKEIPNAIEKIKQENAELFDPADYGLSENYTAEDKVEAGKRIAEEGFKLSVEWTFIPDNENDVRSNTGLSPKQIKAVEDSQRQQIENAQQRIKVNTADAIIETARHLVEKLDEYNPKEKGSKTFRESTVQKVRDLVGVIRVVNWDNDAVLADAANDLTAALGNYRHDDLRNDDDQRKKVAKKVAKVAKDVETAKKMDKLFAA